MPAPALIATLCGKAGSSPVGFSGSVVNQRLALILISGDSGLKKMHSSDYAVLRRPVRPAKLRALMIHALNTDGVVAESIGLVLTRP